MIFGRFGLAKDFWGDVFFVLVFGLRQIPVNHFFEVLCIPRILAVASGCSISSFYQRLGSTA